MVELSEGAKKARREYQKRWREKQGRKKLQVYQATYWERVAAKAAKK